MDKYKTGFRRFFAAILDGLILALPITIITSNFGLKEEYFSALSIFNTVLPILYSVGMHFRYGQTLGKMLVNIQVVDISEDNKLSLKQALLRDSVWIGLEIVGLLMVLYSSNTQQNTILSIIAMIAGNAALVWTVLEIVSMLTNEKRRAVHDLIARTVVVKARKD